MLNMVTVSGGDSFSDIGDLARQERHGAPTPFDTANRQPGSRYMPPSEGRLGVDKAVLFGHGNDHLGLGQLEFGRDLSALISVKSVLEFGPLS